MTLLELFRFDLYAVFLLIFLLFAVDISVLTVGMRSDWFESAPHKKNPTTMTHIEIPEGQRCAAFGAAIT